MREQNILLWCGFEIICETCGSEILFEIFFQSLESDKIFETIASDQRIFSSKENSWCLCNSAVLIYSDIKKCWNLENKEKLNLTITPTMCSFAKTNLIKNCTSKIRKQMGWRNLELGHVRESSKWPKTVPFIKEKESTMTSEE